MYNFNFPSFFFNTIKFTVDIVCAEKPKLDMSKVKDITVKAGQEFRIAVPFTGVPKPTAKWELNGNDIEVSPRVNSKVSALHFCTCGLSPYMSIEEMRL